MWELRNKTPYAVLPGWVRDREGSEVWLVAVRATYEIAPDGTLALAREQDPVCLAPKYKGKPAESTLVYDSDLMPPKPTTDILLHGHAYAPKGVPSPFIDVLMKVGPVSKILRAYGDRYWRVGIFGLKLSDPESAAKVPLSYEYAYGGWDRNYPEEKDYRWFGRNPLGRGFAEESEHLAGYRAPNLEDPRHPVTSWKDRPAPAGFGPIPCHWEPRRKWGGTYDEKWEKERQPLLPKDFDERYYQSAPEDQWPPKPLRGGEEVELVNVTPGGVLRFKLPRLALSFETQFRDRRETHHATLQSVILEPDHPRVILVWLSALPCHPRVAQLQYTVIREKEFVEDLGVLTGTKGARP